MFSGTQQSYVPRLAAAATCLGCVPRGMDLRAVRFSGTQQSYVPRLAAAATCLEPAADYLAINAVAFSTPWKNIFHSVEKIAQHFP